jgi:peptide/nickel transport system substrate-binding protein
VDVKFSVDRFGSDESTNPWSHYLATSYNKKSSAVIDDYTFQYVTDHPEPALVIPFAWTRILPKKYFESVGMEGFRKKPVGSGPWKFSEYTPETTFKMEANTAHWKQVPKFQFVNFVQVPEEATQVAMLKNNEVDIIGVSMDRIVQLQKDGFKAVELGLPTLANISFQGTWLKQAGATNDIRVRQAMSYSLNRQEICDTFYKGNAVPGGRWFMHPGGYGWDNSWKPDVFDLPKAKALLKEANYPAAFTDPTIHIYVSPGPNVDFIQLLQGYWTAAGLKIKIEVVDSVVFGGYFFSFKRLTGTEPNTGWIFPWIFASTQNSIYHASNMFGSWGAHNTGNDPKADELYKKATAELDPVKAQKYWTEFEDYAYTMWVNVGICMIKPLMVVSKNIGEFTTATNISLYDAFAGIQKPK